MQPVCYPYVGFQLFGESYKRGAFMARLNEGYRSYGYQVGRELPDHISVILRFLALGDEVRLGEFGQVLLCEGLVPAVSKMAGAFTKSSAVCSADLSVAPNPYAAVVAALLVILTSELEEMEMDHA